MIIEMGVVVAIALVLWFIKLSWKNRILLLSYPLVLDVTVFTILTMIHWGTFSGVMTAAIGSLICSALISLGRWAFGYKEKGKYVPGVWDVSESLLEVKR